MLGRQNIELKGRVKGLAFMSDQSQKIAARIEKLIRPEIQALKSYHVPNPGEMLKLDAMENPNPWPGALEGEWQTVLKQVEVNRYPDPNASGVKAGLRKLMSLDKLAEQNSQKLDILLGNGSDELIQMIAMCVAKPGCCIMAPEPSFVMYSMIARFTGMRYQGVDLGPNFELDLDRFLPAIKQYQPTVIFLALPNNPTGNLFKLADVTQIIQATEGLVVIDEAYTAFTDSDLLELAAKYDNVVVMRTLSKVGLAGLRLGFLVGAEAWLTQFDKVRLPYNINVLTQASAEFALAHYQMLADQTNQLREQRAELFEQLHAIAGLQVYPSEANFILVRCLQAPAKDVFDRLKERGVLIKCLGGTHPLLSNCLRLTVGRADENAQLLVALNDVLKGYE